MKAIDASPAAALVRVASSNPEAASLTPKGCAVDRDWHATVAHPDVDGVIIATPPATHGAIALAALGAGKAVLIEKPLALDEAEAAAVLADAEARGAVALVDHVHLFHPAYRRLKEEVAAAGGAVRLRAVNGGPGPRRADASVLWDWGPHEAALALDLVGGDVADASAEAVPALGAEPGDRLKLTLSFPGGVRAEAEIGIGFEARCRLFAVATQSAVWVYDEHAPAPLVRLPASTAIDDVTPGRTPAGAVAVAVAGTTPLETLIAAFAASVRAGGPDLDGLRLGVGVVRLLSRLDARR